MSIELAPRKTPATQGELKKFFNAENDYKNLSPEEVKRILNYTSEDAINDAIADAAASYAEDAWNYFLCNSTSIIKGYKKKVEEHHAKCELLIYKENSEFMKRVVNAIADKGAKVKYKPSLYMNSMGTVITFEFNKAISFSDDKELFGEMLRRCSMYLGQSKDGTAYIKCEFFDIGKYIEIGGK